MIQLFRDKFGIQSVQDSRLKDLRQFLDFLNKWKSSAGTDGKKFISSKLFFDLNSMILGFQALVTIKLKAFPNAIIKPAIINQDVVENHFCQAIAK